MTAGELRGIFCGMSVALAERAETQAGQPFRWTRERYDRAVAAGVFANDPRVELLNGQIVTMSPQSRPHFLSIHRLAKELEAVFPEQTYQVCQQGPFAAAADSEPEPDVFVVPADKASDWNEHPSEAVLIAEVAISSASTDLNVKPGIYAAAGVPEYWVLLLEARQVVVFREPEDGAYTCRKEFPADVELRPVAAREGSPALPMKRCFPPERPKK